MLNFALIPGYTALHFLLCSFFSRGYFNKAVLFQQALIGSPKPGFLTLFEAYNLDLSTSNLIMVNFSAEHLKNVQRFAMLACEIQECNNQGDCVLENGLPVCKCWLGYVGDTCGDTVNKGLAIPLTLGVLGFIVGFIMLAFVLALVHQKRQAQKRNEMDEKEPLGKNGDFHSSPVKMKDKEKNIGQRNGSQNMVT